MIPSAQIGSFFLLAIAVVALILSVHKVDEGHVGVYWRGGALTTRVTDPGFHLRVPFLDVFENVQVTLQTDKVVDIPCGTSGGVLIWIDKVEVVNRLRKQYVYDTIKNYTTNYDKVWIFDKIHHEINQFCSKHTLQEVYIDLFHTVDDRLVSALQVDCDKWAPGIEVIAIRITKPRVPPAIIKNYEQMEAEKTKLLISIESQKVAEKEAETERKKATIEAQKNAEVSAIRMEQELNEKESKRKQASIEDETYLHRQKSLTDADFYRLTRQADSNKLIFTDEYIKLELIHSIANNTKIYFGPAINSLFLDWMEKLNIVDTPKVPKTN